MSAPRPILQGTARRSLLCALEDLSSLSCLSDMPEDVSWQDVAGTAALNLRVVAAFLEQARESGEYPVLLRHGLTLFRREGP